MKASTDKDFIHYMRSQADWLFKIGKATKDEVKRANSIYDVWEESYKARQEI